MNHKDYKALKTCGDLSVGTFGGKIYACEMLTGMFSIPEYHQISKTEFDTFELWNKEKIEDEKTLRKVSDRKIICSGFLGCSEISDEDLSGDL